MHVGTDGGKPERLKFELGRHETFPLREGWLAKGLARLKETGGYRGDLDTADVLGLGSRMAKSLAFWLDGAGYLSAPTARGHAASPTPMALAVQELDPHFEYPATVWFVHLMLARRRASVWNWFFNEFNAATFSREACIDSFFRAVRDQGKTPTTPGVAQREVGCLLSTYASPGPGEAVDPEDPTVSPLHSLGLLARQRDTGRFQRPTPADPVPVEVFLACADLLGGGSGSHDLPLSGLAALRDSPGRLFNLDGDAVAEAAWSAAETYRDDGVGVSLQGSVRTITLPGRKPEDWLRSHFRRLSA